MLELCVRLYDLPGAMAVAGLLFFPLHLLSLCLLAWSLFRSALALARSDLARLGWSLLGVACGAVPFFALASGWISYERLAARAHALHSRDCEMRAVMMGTFEICEARDESAMAITSQVFVHLVYDATGRLSGSGRQLDAVACDMLGNRVQIGETGRVRAQRIYRQFYRIVLAY